MDRDQWPLLRNIFTAKFLSKSLVEWRRVFDGTDACVSPVLTIEETGTEPHSIARKLFVAPQYVPSHGNTVVLRLLLTFDICYYRVPAPAPSLSRTPGLSPVLVPAGQFSLILTLSYSPSANSRTNTCCYRREHKIPAARQIQNRNRRGSRCTDQSRSCSMQ